MNESFNAEHEIHSLGGGRGGGKEYFVGDTAGVADLVSHHRMDEDLDVITSDDGLKWQIKKVLTAVNLVGVLLDVVGDLVTSNDFCLLRE